jgi:hypothetical protein
MIFYSFIEASKHIKKISHSNQENDYLRFLVNEYIKEFNCVDTKTILLFAEKVRNHIL